MCLLVAAKYSYAILSQESLPPPTRLFAAAVQPYLHSLLRLKMVDSLGKLGKFDYDCCGCC